MSTHCVGHWDGTGPHSAVTMLCRGGKLMSESDRLGPLLKNLTNSYMGVSEGDGLADRLSLAELDAAAKRSFPLCMKALYAARCQTLIRALRGGAVPTHVFTASYSHYASDPAQSGPAVFCRSV